MFIIAAAIMEYIKTNAVVFPISRSCSFSTAEPEAELLYLPPLHIPDGFFICRVTVFRRFVSRPKPFNRFYNLVFALFLYIDNIDRLRGFQMLNLAKDLRPLDSKTAIPIWNTASRSLSPLRESCGIIVCTLPQHRFFLVLSSIFSFCTVFRFCTIRMRNACPS